MSQPPPLFDRNLLARRRMRAAGLGSDNVLHVEMAQEVSERLSEVNRSFNAPAIVSPLPEIWDGALRQVGLPAAKHVETGETLALAPGAHDLVVHGLDMHWANDPVGQLIQIRHALQPDGLCLVAMFGGETLMELRAALAQAEADLTGGLSPRVAPMGDIRDLGGLLQRAGFALPVADSVKLTLSYQTPLHLMRDLRAMGETNVLSARSRRCLSRDLLANACALYVDHHSLPDGQIRATFEVIMLTGWAPCENQQKPLRPGSAQKRLADALDPFGSRPDTSDS